MMSFSPFLLKRFVPLLQGESALSGTAKTSIPCSKGHPGSDQETASKGGFHDNGA